MCVSCWFLIPKRVSLMKWVCKYCYQRYCAGYCIGYYVNEGFCWSCVALKYEKWVLMRSIVPFTVDIAKNMTGLPLRVIWHVRTLFVGQVTYGPINSPNVKGKSLYNLVKNFQKTVRCVTAVLLPRPHSRDFLRCPNERIYAAITFVTILFETWQSLETPSSTPEGSRYVCPLSFLQEI